MLHTLTFTKIEEGSPLIDEQNNPVTLKVEADSRTGAIYHAETAQFCTTNSCTVKRVTP